MHSYSHVLVPYDASAFAERALLAALTIGRATGATVELVHVHEPLPPTGGGPMYDTRLDRDNRTLVCRALDELEKRLARNANPAVRLSCLTGDVASTLEQRITESGADLVVMSTHGAGGVIRAMMGSVADHVVRHVHVPILLVRPGAMGPLAVSAPLFHHILVPLDGSDFATHVIEPALMLATPGQTELTLLHVLEVPRAPSVAPYPPGGMPLSKADIEREQREARAFLDAVAGPLRARGFTTNTVVRLHARVTRCILDFAVQHDVSLIAISTHGRGGIDRLMFGSVSDAVSREAAFPVLAFRPEVPAT